MLGVARVVPHLLNDPALQRERFGIRDRSQASKRDDRLGRDRLGRDRLGRAGTGLSIWRGSTHGVSPEGRCAP